MNTLKLYKFLSIISLLTVSTAGASVSQEINESEKLGPVKLFSSCDPSIRRVKGSSISYLPLPPVEDKKVSSPRLFSSPRQGLREKDQRKIAPSPSPKKKGSLLKVHPFPAEVSASSSPRLSLYENSSNTPTPRKKEDNFLLSNEGRAKGVKHFFSKKKRDSPYKVVAYCPKTKAFLLVKFVSNRSKKTEKVEKISSTRVGLRSLRCESQVFIVRPLTDLDK